MKFKVLILILIMIFAITSVAFATPKIGIIPPISEPAMMFLFGLFLTGASFLGRKIYAEQKINQNH